MKKIRNFFIYLLVFLAAVIFFAPKEQLYYKAEQELKRFDVIVANESVKDTGAGLHLSEGTIYFKRINSAVFEGLDIKLFGLYNKVEVSGVRLASTFSAFFPENVERIEVTYSILDPLNVHARAVGDFGTAKGVVSLTERTLNATVDPSKLMQSRFGNTLRKLSKDETGGYVYESRF